MSFATYRSFLPDPERFRRYAVLWTPGHDYVFYVDGVETHRVAPEAVEGLEGLAHPMNIKFSTLVATWAGAIIDDLDGRSMDIDWVRVHKFVDHRHAEDSFTPSVPAQLNGGSGWTSAWSENAQFASPGLTLDVGGYQNDPDPSASGVLVLDPAQGDVERRLGRPHSYFRDQCTFVSFIARRDEGAGLLRSLASDQFTRGVFDVSPEGEVALGIIPDSLTASDTLIPAGEPVLVTLMFKGRPGFQPVSVNKGQTLTNDAVYLKVFRAGDDLTPRTPNTIDWDAIGRGGSEVTTSVLRLAASGSGEVLIDEIRVGNTFESVTSTGTAVIKPGDLDRSGETNFLDVIAFDRRFDEGSLIADFNGDGFLNSTDPRRHLDWVPAGH